MKSRVGGANGRLRDLSYLQPWFRAYHDYASEWFRQLTGGTIDIRGRKIGGMTPVVTSTWRSYDEQAALYRDRASNPYPVNAPGDSAHQWGLAVDTDIYREQDRLWRAVREATGLRVPTNDRVHGEYPGWREIVRLAGF